MATGDVLNWVLGGGMVGLIIAVVTLGSAVKKARAEAREAEARAKKAAAEAETVKITNAESATRILINNIVKPLKEELHETRRLLQAAQQAIESLQEAIDRADDCDYRRNCPILRGLRERKAKRSEVGKPDRAVTNRQHVGGGERVAVGKAEHEVDEPAVAGESDLRSDGGRGVGVDAESESGEPP